MRHEAKTLRKLSAMRTVLPFLFITLLVCVVYSADVSDILKGGISYIINNGDTDESSDWSYTCENACVPKEFDENDATERITLETCNMLCGELPLWPKPTDIKVTDKNRSAFNKNRIVIKPNVPDAIKSSLKEASNIFLKNLPETNDFLMDYVDAELFNIYVNISNDESTLQISTNESYYLSVEKVEDNIEVTILAPTFFGARHALETLNQLIWLDTATQKLNIIHDVEINDVPEFAHRGLMVDTARNYFYVEQLKKVLDGMAASKLNVFHLHLTDASSFPVVLPRNEKFARYGAYSPEMVYTAEDIKGLVEYARIRGIRVILEVDAPSHVTPNLNRAKKDLVICGEDAVFNGHLNPQNNETLQVLEDIYKDLLDLGTDNNMFHIGGDEVNVTCWNQVTVSKNQGVRSKHDYKRNSRLDSMSVWKDFTNKMFDALISANEKTVPEHIVIWSSDLTDYYLSGLSHTKNVVVQYWYGSISSVLANGNKVILSTVGHWYLDCGYGSWKTVQDTGVCDPYTSWHTFYKYRPWEDEFPDNRKQILGGEACLWSEMVEVDALETRIWPRTAALAERLWSDPDTFDRKDVYKRLDIHRERLRSRGVKSEGIWPRWCSQNPGRC